MKTMKIYVLITAALMWSLFLNGQTISDALRYSTFEFGTTGRALGTNNSYSALGADFSLIGSNPAGLASFRKSEFVITPGVFNLKTTSELDNSAVANSLSDSRTNFNLSNIGFVFSGSPAASHWRTVNFSIGLNRLANYHQDFFFEGATQGSITDRWRELATGLMPSQLDNFEAGLAFDAGALIPSNMQGEYFTDFAGVRTPVSKSQQYRTGGAFNEFSMALAANYEDKVYAGIVLGVPFVSYEETKIYEEKDPNGEIPVFNSLSYRENLRVTGVGVNAKIGLIFRLSQALRVGASLHTPSRLGLEEFYSTQLTYDYTDSQNNGPINAESPEGNFEYRLITPWRYSGSAGYIIGKKGFVGLEAEIVNHQSAKFDFKTSNPEDLRFERELNSEINSNFKPTLNVRLGGEMTVIDIFRIRAGIGFGGSPYRNDNTIYPAYSLGVGLRERSFFLDLAYRWFAFDEGYIPYKTLDGVAQSVQNRVNGGLFVATFGFKL